VGLLWWSSGGSHGTDGETAAIANFRYQRPSSYPFYGLDDFLLRSIARYHGMMSSVGAGRRFVGLKACKACMRLECTGCASGIRAAQADLGGLLRKFRHTVCSIIGPCLGLDGAISYCVTRVRVSFLASLF